MVLLILTKGRTANDSALAPPFGFIPSLCAVSLLRIKFFKTPFSIKIFFVPFTPSSSYGNEPKPFSIAGSSYIVTSSDATFSPIFFSRIDSPETTESPSAACPIASCAKTPARSGSVITGNLPEGDFSAERILTADFAAFTPFSKGLLLSKISKPDVPPTLVLYPTIFPSFFAIRSACATILGTIV